MNRMFAVVVCSAVLGGCGSMSKMDDNTALLQQMQEEQNQQLAELRDQINKQQSSTLTSEEVAAIVEARFAVTNERGIEEDIQPQSTELVSVRSVTNSDGFAAAELAENCIVRIMSVGSEVNRPTTAKAAAYVCSHVYGLNHKRTIEAQQAVYALDKDSNKFKAELSQEISDDSDIVLDVYGFEPIARR